MASVLKLKAGSRITSATKLFEGYQVSDEQIIANVSIDKIESVMRHFIAMHHEPLFFILELPASLKQEKEVKPGVIETFHKDVYYIDGRTQEEAIAIMLRAGDVLFNDGMSSFGYGGHRSGDEIMFEKYNVLTIYTKHPENYTDFFETHDIQRDDALVLAWDTFTKKTPGDSRLYEANGMSVYDIPEQFKDWGIYCAERRED